MSTKLTVDGMSCGHCEQTVEDAVRDLPGVAGVSADNEANEVVVDGDVDLDAVTAAIEDAGYEPNA